MLDEEDLQTSTQKVLHSIRDPGPRRLKEQRPNAQRRYPGRKEELNADMHTRGSVGSMPQGHLQGWSMFAGGGIDLLDVVSLVRNELGEVEEHLAQEIGELGRLRGPLL